MVLFLGVQKWVVKGRKDWVKYTQIISVRSVNAQACQNHWIINIRGVFGYFVVAFLDEVKRFLMNIGTNEIISFDILKTILFIIGIAGISIISYVLLYHLYTFKIKERKLNTGTDNNIKTEYSSVKRQIPYRKSTPDSKLSDLINEIESFNNKWQNKTFWNKLSDTD